MEIVVGGLAVIVLLELVALWVAFGEMQNLTKHRAQMIQESNTALNWLATRLTKLESDKTPRDNVLPLHGPKGPRSPQPPRGGR